MVELTSVEEDVFLVEEKTRARIKEKRNYFKIGTLRIRHFVARKIAPKVYGYAIDYSMIWNATPRPMIQIVREHFSHADQLTGAEIGVEHGRNALSILQTLRMRKLYLIDIIQTEEAKPIHYFGNVEWLIMKSEEAYKRIHESLDFCYIDGNHTYLYAKKDLESYWPLVKSGGVIGGHDITEQYPDVKKAAKEFAHRNNVELNICFPDFWMIKP